MTKGYIIASKKNGIILQAGQRSVGDDLSTAIRFDTESEADAFCSDFNARPWREGRPQMWPVPLIA